MDRRKFVALGSTAFCMAPLSGIASFIPRSNPLPDVKPGWLVNLVHLNDTELKNISAFKITDLSNKYVGGYEFDTGIPNPHATCGFINHACAAVSCPESAYYQSATVLTDIGLALQSLLKMQHADGTIDLVETNFHSTPDTAFMVERMVLSYNLLKRSGMKDLSPSLVLFEQFFKRAGEALITGGIHTPNHRWVVSAALVKLNEQWPDPRYIKRVNDWLDEHIDIDPDGQYTEKSTYGYSAIVDRVLITVAKGLNKPFILDAVRKNLLMMRYYLHPNGEVVTEASNRQDKGQVGTMENYYYACRYMALHDNDGELSAMCQLIETTASKKLGESLNYLLDEPALWKELPATKPLPVSYVKSFPYSGVVRIRRNEWDATILSNNPGWLTFHKGNAVLQAMRVATSFFGKGQFQSDTIKQQNNSWVLSKKLEGPYFQPYPKDKIPADGDVAKMPKSNRAQSNVQYLDSVIVIEESNNGISVDIEIKGTDGVPVCLELIFRRGGVFSGVTPHATKADAWLFSAKEGTYSVGKDTIHFGPGMLEHRYIQVRGALPAMEAPTVYLTGFTPFKYTLRVS